MNQIKSLALIININYKNTQYQITNNQDNEERIKKLLINEFNYLEENITILSENDTNPKNHPTAINIMNNLGKLIIQAYNKNVDHIFIYYSGHGSYICDKNNDEKDNHDEVIIPSDFHKMGVITDDILHEYLEYIPENCHCFGLFDCYHQGTLLDLKYKYLKNYRMITENPNSNALGNIIMISGYQNNNNTNNNESMINTQSHGIITNAFFDTLEKYNYQTTFFHLLDEMNHSLEENGNNLHPQLTSSRKLNHTDIFSRNSPSIPMFETKNI